MPSRCLVLKKTNRGWVLVSEAGVQLNDTPFRGDADEAIRWGNAFVSSWYNFSIKLEEEYKDEEKNRLLGEIVRTT